MSGFDLQRDFASKLVAVGAITDRQFADLMMEINAHESRLYEQQAHAAAERRREWEDRPWWRRIFASGPM